MRLGNNAPQNHNFKFITKLPSQGPAKWGWEKVQEWESSLHESLDALNTPHIDTLLLHNVNDLRHNDSFLLIDWIKSLKHTGLLKNFGVSIYDSNDLVGVDLSLIDSVQLPLSIYDQRCLRNGTIDYLVSNDILVS